MAKRRTSEAKAQEARTARLADQSLALIAECILKLSPRDSVIVLTLALAGVILLSTDERSEAEELAIVDKGMRELREALVDGLQKRRAHQASVRAAAGTGVVQ